MRAQGTGSATIFMLTVLAVMAVIGVFGLPQFEPVVASSNTLDVDDERWSDSVASYERAGAGESAAQGAEDLFAPTEASADMVLVEPENRFEPLDLDRLEERAANERQIVDLIAQPTQRSVGSESRHEHHLLATGTPSRAESGHRAALRSNQAFGETAKEPAKRQPAGQTEFDSRFGRDFARNSAASTEAKSSSRTRREIPFGPAQNKPADNRDSAGQQPLTWRAAVARLNSLGIRNYQLSPGSQANEFHFSCFIKPANNPRLTRRFEAEASEPLQAVQKVLAQVNEWRSNR